MDNNNLFGNNNQNVNEDPFQNQNDPNQFYNQQNQNIPNQFYNQQNQNIPNQFYNQNIPNNNYIPPQNNYNESFNRQYADSSVRKSPKGIYIILITVLICFAVIIFLMFTVMRSMLDGGSKKQNDNNTTLSENVTGTDQQTESPVTTAAADEKVTEIVTVIVEVTEPPTTKPSFSSYTYTINNYNLPLYADADYNSNLIKFITDRGTYTITEQSGQWGKLSTGGWINIDDAELYGNTSYAGAGYVSTQTDPLTLRYAPASNSKSLTSIPRHTSIDVYYTDLPDWFYTTYNGKSGFVSAKYVSMGTPPKTTVSSYYGCGTVATKKDPLNLRSEASTGASIITSIPKGTVIDLYLTSESGWYYTTYNGKSGFVKSDYISFAPVYESYAPLTAVINTKSDPLNLRETASTSGKIITAIPKGTTVTVIDYYSDWCYIQWGGYTGYASTEYLAF